MRVAVALFLALFACLNACAQPLWRDVPVGATVEEVQKKLPAATQPEKLSAPVRGISALLEYRGFQVADIDFKATLYFKGGGLDRVSLQPVEEQTGVVAQGVALRLRDSLVAKYGAPVSSENRGVSRMRADWTSDGVQIRFGFDQYSENGVGFFILTYVAPQDAGNI